MGYSKINVYSAKSKDIAEPVVNYKKNEAIEVNNISPNKKTKPIHDLHESKQNTTKIGKKILFLLDKECCRM